MRADPSVMPRPRSPEEQLGLILIWKSQAREVDSRARPHPAAAHAAAHSVNWAPFFWKVKRRLFGRRFASSRKRDVVVLQRERADALARGRKVRIEHGGRGDADRRLADATPETAGWHKGRFDLRHLGDAHRVVVIEVGLLDAAVLDGAFLIEQRGQAVHERARDLPLDLSWIDSVSRIGGGNNAMNLDLVAVDRDFGAGGHITGERHSLRKAAVDALRCRRAPARLGRHGIEHAEVLWMLRHQLAPELERVDAHLLCKLVHEAFEINGVVDDVHAAPEAWIDVR